MEHIRERLESFEDKHPVWFWLLVRLVICFCWTAAAFVATIALVAAIAPFLEEMVVVWMLIPVCITVVWGLVSFALWLFAEFC